MKNLIYNIMVIIFIGGFVTIVATLIGLIWGMNPVIASKVALTSLVLIAASGISLVMIDD